MVTADATGRISRWDQTTKGGNSMGNRKFRIKFKERSNPGNRTCNSSPDNKVMVVETDETGGRITYRCKSME